MYSHAALPLPVYSTVRGSKPMHACTLPPGVFSSFRPVTSAKILYGPAPLASAGQAKKPVAPRLEKPSEPNGDPGARVKPSKVEPGGYKVEWAWVKPRAPVGST